MSHSWGTAPDSFELTAMNCHHRFFSLRSFFESAERNGFRTAEIWTCPQHFFIDYAQNESIAELVGLEREYNVSIVGICPEQTNPKPANMAAAGRPAQDRVFRYFTRIIDLACAVQARYVVVTSGWAYFDEPAQDAWRRSVLMLRRVASYAGERGMILAIEALQEWESVLVNSTIDLERLISDVGEPALKVCLDIGAMERAGDTIEDYFQRFGSDVVHMHFVDVSDQTTHLAWGDGKRDMSADLRALLRYGYQGALSGEYVCEAYYKNPSDADRQSIQRFRCACEELQS